MFSSPVTSIVSLLRCHLLVLLSLPLRSAVHLCSLSCPNLLSPVSPLCTLPSRPDINKRLGGVLAIDELIDVKVSLGWQQQRETTRQGL